MRPPISLAQPGPLSLGLLQRGVRLVVQPGCKEQGPSEDPAKNWSKETHSIQTLQQNQNQNRALQRTISQPVKRPNVICWNNTVQLHFHSVLFCNRLQLRGTPFQSAGMMLYYLLPCWFVVSNFFCCMFVFFCAKLFV